MYSVSSSNEFTNGHATPLPVRVLHVTRAADVFSSNNRKVMFQPDRLKLEIMLL